MSDPQANKQGAIDFYELMFNDNRPREAQERYTGAVEAVGRRTP